MQNDAAPPDVPPVALVGAGAVGTVLGRSLSANGGQVAAVLSRSEGSAQSLADRVGAPTAGALGETPLPADVELFFLCVPDDAIAEVATALAAAPHSWPNAIVAHTSGAKTASVLAPLAQEGAATMSFHPLQTCTETTAPDALDGIVVGLEGDGRALTVGERVARLIGAQPVQLTPTEKARYHAAAVLASNGLVALLAVVEELFGSLDSSPSDRSGADLLGPLVEQTWTHLRQGAPEDALTGPVMRGDLGTVEAHLDALDSVAPHLVPLYAALSTEMVRAAVRGDHLGPERAESILEALRTATDGASVPDEASSPSR